MNQKPHGRNTQKVVETAKIVKPALKGQGAQKAVFEGIRRKIKGFLGEAQI